MSIFATLNHDAACRSACRSTRSSTSTPRPPRLADLDLSRVAARRPVGRRCRSVDLSQFGHLPPICDPGLHVTLDDVDDWPIAA